MNLLDKRLNILRYFLSEEVYLKLSQNCAPFIIKDKISNRNLQVLPPHVIV